MPPREGSRLNTLCPLLIPSRLDAFPDELSTALYKNEVWFLEEGEARWCQTDERTPFRRGGVHQSAIVRILPDRKLRA